MMLGKEAFLQGEALMITAGTRCRKKLRGCQENSCAAAMRQWVLQMSRAASFRSGSELMSVVLHVMRPCLDVTLPPAPSPWNSALPCDLYVD